jgi:sugar phosphate isomerase/epimerase
MQIKILSPLWGYEQENLASIIEKIAMAGYDGIDTHVPDSTAGRKKLLDCLESHQLSLVVQQHQAQGDTFEEFKQSFLHYLKISAEANPMLINSHTGRDHFSFEQNLELIDAAQSFSEKSGIETVHETHRGRFAFSPLVAKEYFSARPGLNITADLSHWVCVTESFLEHFAETLDEAIARTRHIHARAGYTQSPQVPDPRAPEWQEAVNIFFSWWDKMIEAQAAAGRKILTITTEFGPPPYLQTVPFTGEPVADQFEINCFMKDKLRKRYASYIQ